MQVKHFHIRIDQEHLENDQEMINSFLKKIKVLKTTAEVIEINQNHYWSMLVFYEPLNRSSVGRTKISHELEDLNEEEIVIYDTLRKWRYNKAEELELEIYMICGNNELISIAKEKPKSVEELIQIKGFGSKKSQSYGEDIFAIVNGLAN